MAARAAGVDALRDLALADAATREQLLASVGDDAFVETALALAVAHHLDVTEAELRAALTAGDRRRIERWL